MRDTVDEEVLIAQGMRSYWDARFAINTFEDHIIAMARGILIDRLPDIPMACDPLMEVKESDLWVYGPIRNCGLGLIAMGTAFGGDVWQVRLGLGWRVKDGGSDTQAMACTTIAVVGRPRRDRIASALRRASVDQPHEGVTLDCSNVVTSWAPVSQDTDKAKVADAMQAVLAATLGWCRAHGGIRQIIDGPA